MAENPLSSSTGERKVIVDLLIGNKEQCAVNTYAVEAITCLPTEIREKIEYREWSVLNEEGRRKKGELKARVIPTLALDGEICFEGVLPPLEELEEAIRSRLPSQAQP
ncbi:MAG: hypothetical protein HYY20_13535 [Candidatus Tectomicrobia bacterium]|uniref:Thioredoxin-like fold domain-containing protein n=1 Tax=Tectimicrobiota bacterium TaxID=2528274 RepID=A0A932CR78_UNCTE|nr:hypothetical protein [Candidatus Tectomicrobia bacterium]